MGTGTPGPNAACQTHPLAHYYYYHTRYVQGHTTCPLSQQHSNLD